MPSIPIRGVASADSGGPEYRVDRMWYCEWRKPRLLLARLDGWRHRWEEAGHQCIEREATVCGVLYAEKHSLRLVIVAAIERRAESSCFVAEYTCALVVSPRRGRGLRIMYLGLLDTLSLNRTVLRAADRLGSFRARDLR